MTVAGWPAATTQPGDVLRDLLAAMGADGRPRRRRPDRSAATGASRGIDADLRDVGELDPGARRAGGARRRPSQLPGRRRTCAATRPTGWPRWPSELNALGGDVVELPDGLDIHPRPLHGGVWHAYADHRMATAGAVLGLAVDGVVVEDIATTRKTLPDFAGIVGARCCG